MGNQGGQKMRPCRPSKFYRQSRAEQQSSAASNSFSKRPDPDPDSGLQRETHFWWSCVTSVSPLCVEGRKSLQDVRFAGHCKECVGGLLARTLIIHHHLSPSSSPATPSYIRPGRETLLGHCRLWHWLAGCVDQQRLCIAVTSR